MSQRDDIATLSPPWLKGYNSNGERFLYTFGLACDTLLEKMNQAQRAHMPGEGDDSALPYLAEDRLLVQGPAETDAQLTARLRDAFTAWSRAGSRRAVLEQIQAFLQGTQPGVAAAMPEALIVGGNASLSTWHSLAFSDAQGAPPARRLVTPANWNWDGVDQPWRAWLVLFMSLVATGQAGSSAAVLSTGGSGVTGVTSGFATITGLSGMVAGNNQQYLTISGAASSANNGTFQIVSVLGGGGVIIANPAAVAPDANNGALVWSVGQYPFIRPAPVWGSPDFVWGNGWTWGIASTPTTATANLAISIRQIVQRWKSAGTFYPKIIVSFGGGDGTAGNEFSPLSGQGTGNPDGTFADYGRNVNGVWAPDKPVVNRFTSFLDGTGVYQQCTIYNIT